MNIVNPSVELWKQGSGIQGMYDHIERCARICYRSENKGKVTSEQFVKGLIKRRHMRPLEFGTLCFSFGTFPDWNEKVESPWFKECNGWLVTNLRWLIEHAPFNWEMYVMISDQQGGLNPNLTNYYRPTFHWNISRGIADEFRTHVMLSSLMESTRYVNYHRVGKDGMKNLNDKNNHMDFVTPSWYNPNSNYGILERAWAEAENRYSEMIEKGYKPQQAREVLPLSIATNLVQCGFRNAWDNFFNLRCDKAAHPDCQLIATKAKKLYETMLFNHIQSN
jgi:thymidylate synthase (FAD)